MNSPDPVPAPEQPPVAMPWWKSTVFRGILTIVVAQVVNHAQAQFHFDTTALGFGVNDIVALIMDMISAGALAYMGHGRATQKAAPVITGTQTTADQINAINPPAPMPVTPLQPEAKS